MSSSTTARSGSQNNSERPSSSRTSTAACSELPPARLDRAVHPGKLGFPVPFPHPHHCASTSFVRFHEVHLCLLLVGDRATPSPSFRRFTVRSALHPSQFVVPVKLNASILKPHVHRQVLRMSVRFLYSADASFPGPVGSIEHSHQSTDTHLIRIQEDRLRVVFCLGPDPYTGGNTGPDPNR